MNRYLNCVKLTLVSLFLVVAQYAYCGCGGPEVGMIYEAAGFHFVITAEDESSVCQSTSSRVGDGWCFDAVNPLPKYSGDIVIPAQTTAYLGIGFADCATTGIAKSAFEDCTNLRSVTMPSSVTHVDDYAFRRCTYLQSVTFGSGVVSLGVDIFKGCSNLETIVFEGNVPAGLAVDLFDECVNLTTIYVPCGKLNLYKKALPTSADVRVIVPYSYTIESNNALQGTVQVSEYDCTTKSITATATPNSGWQFSHWSDGNTSNPRTIVLAQDIALVALFNPLNSGEEQEGVKHVLDLTSMATNINLWTITNATLNSKASDLSALKYVYDIQEDKTAEAYVTITPNIVFACNYYTYSTGEDFIIYLSRCFEFNKNGGVIRIKNTTAGEKITLTVANVWEYSYGYLNQLVNAKALSNDLSLPEKNISDPNADSEGYVWKTLEYESTGGDVEISGTASSYRIRKVQINYSTAQVSSGYCGDNLKWEYKNNALIFTGYGNMRDFTATTIPWADYISDITSIQFAKDMTSIGDYAFQGVNTRKFNSLILPNGITRIGKHAFDNCTFLDNIEFNENLDLIDENAFKNCTRVMTMTSWSPIAPTVESGALTSIKSNAELYVLSSAYKKYQFADEWSRFDLKEIGATLTTTTTNDVVVDAADNTAVFTWPISSSAVTYTLAITKEGETFCTLVFNANGQLTGIAFAPKRNGEPHGAAAAVSNEGMQFTVTGLDIATRYAYSLTAKNSSSKVVASYSGSFGTTGADEAIENIDIDTTEPAKILHNGQIYILRGEKVFTLQGQEIK